MPSFVRLGGFDGFCTLRFLYILVAPLLYRQDLTCECGTVCGSVFCCISVCMSVCVCPFTLCLMDVLAVRAELSIVVQVDLRYGEISPLWRFREVLIIEGTLPKFPLLGECLF